MAKNILIFADGTGQIGGEKPDQRLSNVYKIYRATRPGPLSPISYNNQIAYYDPGLGAGEKEGITFHKIRSFLESAVGAGIEDNMVDCYEKIISYYEPGDRIILIGFSRGAYTVRALANMMNLCGVPITLPCGAPVPKKGPILRCIAVEAVKKVYGHGTGRPRGEKSFWEQREKKGERFRLKYGSTPIDGSKNVRGNVEPHFVGVFDTVAALQNSVIIWAIRLGFWLAALTFAASLYLGWAVYWQIFFGLITIGLAVGYCRTVWSQIRFFEPDPEKPLRLWNPFHWRQLLKNTHRAYWRKEHYDQWLSPEVGHARHALSIDEDRADFPRVGWGTRAAVQKNANKMPRWLNQVWFAGCHSDVGGSYPEDESRLSDISLQWMVEELKDCVPSIEIQDSQLRTTPDPLGLQHEEVYIQWWFKWKKKPREVESQFNLHPTVLERLRDDRVPHPNKTKPYRPPQLKDHWQAKDFY